MVTLKVRDMVFVGKHGANPHELVNSQRFRVSMALEVDVSQAIASDALADTVNWSTLRKRVKAIIEHQSFVLVETLTWHLLQMTLEDPRVIASEVTVEKLDAWSDHNGVPSITMVQARETL